MRLVRYSTYVGFLAALIIVGIPYWLIPYSKVSLPNSLAGPSLVVVVAVAAISRALDGASFGRTVAIVGASVPAAVLLRAAVEISIDATSHNLWPIELLIAAIVGFGCSTAGAALGVLIARVIRNDAPVTNS